MKTWKNFVALGLFATLGCVKRTDSKQKGYHENQTANDSNAFRGKVTAVPEYQPVESVIVSAMLARADFAEAVEKAGAKVITVPSESVWARDWSGFTVKTSDGKNAIAEFNYYPVRDRDNATPEKISAFVQAPRISVPLFLEGGNFMVNDSGACYFSEWAFQEQGEFELQILGMDPAAPHVLERQREIIEDRYGFDKTKFQSTLEAYLGCKKGAKIVPAMPHESTGHIDMWAKFISDNVVLVNQLMMTDNTDSTQLDIDFFLEERASEFVKDGFTVVRLPMPPPEIITRVDSTGATYEKSVFRSYTNFLQVNGHALVPSYGPAKLTKHDYTKQAFERALRTGRSPRFETAAAIAANAQTPSVATPTPTPFATEVPTVAATATSVATVTPVATPFAADDAYYTKLEAEVEKLLTANALKVTWLPAEELIRMGGAVHCTTMQISK